MFKQEMGNVTIEIVSRDEDNHLGKRDVGFIKVYVDGELTDEAWITISKHGIARLTRIE